MAKDHKGEHILWVVMYQEPYEADWHFAGIYDDIEGATAHVSLIASPYCGEAYKIESREVTATKDAIKRLKDSKKRKLHALKEVY